MPVSGSCAESGLRRAHRTILGHLCHIGAVDPAVPPPPSFYLPNSVPAAIIMTAVISLINFPIYTQAWRAE